MVEGFEQFFQDDLSKSLEDAIVFITGCDESKKKKEINQLLGTFSNSSKGLKTRYLGKKKLEQKNLYIPPQNIVVDDEEKLSHAPSIGQFITIKLVLKKFFETSDNFEKLQTFMRELENNGPRMLRHFCQGSLWKEIKTKFPEKYLVPLFLYFDDFCVGNTLGSHSSSNKIGAVYYTIPAFAPQFPNNLDNIFTALLFKSNDRGAFGNAAVFDTLINYLKSLEDKGLIIEPVGKSIVLHFAMGLILSDNLGVHSLLGFFEGFTANYPCRACKVHKNAIRQNSPLDTNL